MWAVITCQRVFEESCMFHETSSFFMIYLFFPFFFLKHWGNKLIGLPDNKSFDVEVLRICKLENISLPLTGLIQSSHRRP